MNSTQTIKNTWDHWLIILAGVCVSTLHVKQFYYSHDTLKWFAFDLLLSLFVLKNWPKRLAINFSPFITLIALLTCYMLLSLTIAPNKMMGIEFIYRFILVIAVSYCLIKNHKKHGLLNLMLDTVVFSALIFCIVFVIERYILGLSYNVGSYSPIGFMNNAGQIFNIWIPMLVLYAFINRNSPIKIVLSISLLLCIVTILMEAATRGTIVGLALGELIVFAIMLVQNRKRALYFLSITLLLSSGLIAFQTFDAIQSGRLSSKIAAFEKGISASTGRRMDMFQNTMEMSIDNPLGVGINNFEYLHPKYAKAGTPSASPYVNENTILRTPHNIILKLYSELGWLGGSLFTLFLGWLFLMALFNAIKGTLVDKWVAVAVVATLFHSMVSAVFLTPASLFFSTLLFSMVILRFNSLRVRDYKKAIYRSNVLRFSWLSIPLLSGLLITSEYYAYHGRMQFDGNLLTTATKLNPYNDRAWYALSHVKYRRERNLSASLAAIDKFLMINPYHIAGLYVQSERHYQLGNKRQAKESIDRLLGIYPSYGKAQRLKRVIEHSIAK